MLILSSPTPRLCGTVCSNAALGSVKSDTSPSSQIRMGNSWVLQERGYLSA
jgi:hypothetical protein